MLPVSQSRLTTTLPIRRVRGHVLTRKILFVLNRVDDQSGGTLRAAVNTAEALAGAEVQVTFAVPVVAGIATRTLDTMVDDVEVLKFKASRPAARFGASARHFWWLVRQVRDYDCVHIHSSFYLGAVYTAIICRVRRVPWFVWSHGSLDHYDLNKHRQAKALVGPVIIRPLLSGSSGVICTTERESRELQTYGSPVRRRVVPLAVVPLDLEAVDGRQWRKTNDIAATAFVVLFFGRIAPKKGLVRLIEALALVADLDVVLAIAGAGDDSRDTDLAEDAVADRGLADKVRFLGWLEHEERTGAFAAADVFALPSDNENFAIAVVEALLARIPVVISNQVYLGDDLGPLAAAIVVDRDPAAIATEIRRLHEDPDRAAKVAAAGQNFAMANFQPAAVAVRLLAECEL